MKAILLLALLLVSVAFLGCIQQPESSGPSGGEQLPGLEEQSFDSEEAAFTALENELAGIEDLSPEELEKALQD